MSDILYTGDWGDVDEMVGADDDGVYVIGDDGQFYEVGRRGKRRRNERRDNRRGGGGGQAQKPRLLPAPQAMQVRPAGEPMRHQLIPNAARRQPLGIPVTQVPAATGPTAPGFAQAVVNVQREFQGQRLILSAIENGVPTVPDALSGVALSIFLVGSVNQLPSGVPQTAQGYRADAIAAELELTPATVGTIITIGFQNFLSQSVTVSGVLFGMTRGEG